MSTRDKILNTAFSLVYTKGYNGTSTSMILKECSIPKGSLYHYFPSKKELVLSVVKERIAPKMDEFYELKQLDGENEIDTIIRYIMKISQNEVLISFGCPLNRLNQEMSPIDDDFEKEINLIYTKIKNKIKLLLDKAKLNQPINSDDLSEYIINTVWGNISLSPKQSSKNRFLKSIKFLIFYLESLKN